MGKCVIKSDPQRLLVGGYTKVKIMPDNYSKIIMIAGITGKTIQDVVGELLTYAIDEVQIEDNVGNIVDINSNKQKGDKK